MWQQIIITASVNDAETIADLLTELGALSTTLTDAADEPLFQEKLNDTPLWQTTKITALFTTDIALEPIINFTKQQFKTAIFDCQLETLAEKNWVAETQRQFPAKCFANHLWVVPSWENPSDYQGSVVRIDPGLAFGTGTHPTTHLCLQWLAENPPKDLTVIDYGCGSGILALAALALGAQKCCAIDYDPQALQATQNNANLNPNFISTSNLLIQKNDQKIIFSADLILANILAKPLIELAPLLIAHCKKGATIVVSGLLVQEIELVKAAYINDCSHLRTQQQDEWALMAFKKL